MKSMLNEPLPFSFIRMKTTLFATWTALCLGGAALPAAEEIKPMETIELPESLDVASLINGYTRATQFCVTPNGKYVLGAGYHATPFFVDIPQKKVSVIPSQRPDDGQILYLDNHCFLFDDINEKRWLDFKGRPTAIRSFDGGARQYNHVDGGFMFDRLSSNLWAVGREMQRLGLSTDYSFTALGYVWLQPKTDGCIAFSVDNDPVPLALITPGFPSSYLFPTDRVFATDFCWERASRRLALLYQKLPLQAAPMTRPFFRRLPQLISGYAVFDYKGKLIDDVPIHVDRAYNPVALNLDGEDSEIPLSMFYACLHRDYLYFIDKGGLFVRDLENKETRLLCAGIGEASLPDFRFGFMQRFKVMPNGVVAFVALTSIPGGDPSNGRDTYVALMKDGKLLASKSLRPVDDYRLSFEIASPEWMSHLYQSVDNYLIVGLHNADAKMSYHFIDTDNPEHISDSPLIRETKHTRFHPSLIRGKLYGITDSSNEHPAYIGIYALEPERQAKDGDEFAEE